MTHETLREKYKIYYDKDWHIVNRKSGHENKIYYNITKHKYGEDRVYALTSAGGSQTLARVIWTYFKGDIPKGYDVDHIDGDPLNNSLDNLQLLTRAENLRKRAKNGANQNTVNMTEEERLRINAENKAKREQASINRGLREKGKVNKEKLLAERDRILREREHYRTLLQRVDEESREEVDAYIRQLTKEKQQINALIRLPLKDLGKEVVYIN